MYWNWDPHDYIDRRTYRSLKRAWTGYKIAKKDGDHDNMKYYAEGIQKFERQLHLPVSNFLEIRLAQNYDLANGENSDVIQHQQEIVIPNVKAYKLFAEGKSPLEVTSELNLPGPQVQQFYVEYLNMMRMYKLVSIYQEAQDSMGYFLKLFRLGKENGVSPDQIMNLVQMADIIHKLKDKLQQMQSEISNISKSKTVAKDQLRGLHDEIEAAQEKLNLVNKTFEVKYEELKEACSQAQKLQNYVEQFKDSQDYQELESIVQSEVGKAISDNKKLLQNALFSVLLALRNDPDRYFIVDRMELTPFTTTMIINYNSFQESRRPSYQQGSERFSERVLEMAGKILYNLQKAMVDSTISSAAGLEEGDSYSAAYQALPYSESSSQLPNRGGSNC
jgi:archaellum component FlaC